MFLKCKYKVNKHNGQVALTFAISNKNATVAMLITRLNSVHAASVLIKTSLVLALL
jgi:hypothetical protein